MKKMLFFVMVLIALLSVPSFAEKDIWSNLKFLEGTWVLQNDQVSNIQSYTFFFEGQYLRMETRAVFTPTPKNPAGEVHEDLGIFSYDSSLKKIILRSFHSEGFVNTYHLADAPLVEKALVFESIAVENAPPGTRARLVLELSSTGQLSQKFFVAWPNKEFSCFSNNLFTKKADY